MKYDPETMKVKLCKKCKGLGFSLGINGERYGCPECNGSGRILLKTIKDDFTMDELNENHVFDRETMKVRICKSCSGLGRFVYGPDDSRPCQDCGGTGRIVGQEISTEYPLHHLDEFGKEVPLDGDGNDQTD